MNKLFQNSKFLDAFNQYQALADTIGSFVDTHDLTLEDKKRCMDAKVTCRLNGALCLLKRKRYRDASSLIDALLKQDLKPAHHVTALYRKGVAQEGLGKSTSALKVYEEALKIDPQDQRIQDACERLRASPKDVEECERFLETGQMPSFARQPENLAEVHQRFPKLQEALDRSGFTLSNIAFNPGSK